MKYYEWDDQYSDVDKQMIWGLIPKSEHSHIDFSNGEEVNENVEYLKFVIDWHPESSQMGYLTDFSPQMGLSGLLITEKAVKVLQQVGVENIQTFNVEIIDEKNNKTYTDYKVVNIVGLCDAVDYGKSELVYTRRGTLIEYEKLVLDERKIPDDLLIFRLEKFKPMVIVHEKVKRAVEQAGLTGFVIEPTYRHN